MPQEHITRTSDASGSYARPSRREFIGLGAGVTAMAAANAFSINTRNANEKIIVGLLGVRNRGRELARMFLEQKDADLAFLADPDTNLFRHLSPRIGAIRGEEPVCEQDFRRLLDNPAIDAIVIATPDHWHALGAIMACQAGKDVFVEKPTCHSIWEGEKLVEATEKYGRVVQVGLQNRSMPCVLAARAYIQSGELGDVHFVRVMNNKARPPLTGGATSEPPEGVNYDLWLGPAADRPFSAHHFHYNWHWFWQYSGGDIMNDGVHQLDIVRFLLDLPLPEQVYSTGGKFFFTDAQETPDTQTALYDYPSLTISLEQTLWTRYMKKDPHEIEQLKNTPWNYNGTRIEIYGTKQHLILARHGGGWEAFDGNGVSLHRERSERADRIHVANFLECMRSRATPATSIIEGHRSTLLCIHGNISCRLGRALKIDSATGAFQGDAEANADFLVRRDYRDPWRVPEQV